MRVFLLGHPVEHSLSPRMQNAAFAAARLDWEYVLRDVLPEELEMAVREVEYANVTAPYKLDAARILGSDLSSVNTIVRGRGFSTDAAVLAAAPDRARPAIVGDGGAAAAFKQALPEARVFSRRGEWPPDVHDADLVIHATPVRDEVVFELGPGQTLVDLPYPRTATADTAAAAGARVLDGLEVLVEKGGWVDEISVTGGGARLPYWGELLAAALSRPLTYRRGSEVGAALGAARLARLALGGEQVEDVCVPPPVDRVVQPDAALTSLLDIRRRVFQRLYKDLKSVFEEYSA